MGYVYTTLLAVCFACFSVGPRCCLACRPRLLRLRDNVLSVCVVRVSGRDERREIGGGMKGGWGLSEEAQQASTIISVMRRSITQATI